MYPKDDFNQRLQLAFGKDDLKQIIIEIQESYGDVGNRTLDLDRDKWQSIEYYSGVLEITYGDGKRMVTEFIEWSRIRGIVFSNYVFRFQPFPATSHNSTRIDSL